MIRFPNLSLIIAVTFSCVTLHGAAAHGQAQDSFSTAHELTSRGIELYKQGDNKSAVATLRRAVKKDKDDAEAWYYLGAALNRNSNIKDAGKAFKKAIELRPEHAPSHVGLAFVLLANNKLEEALSEIRRALKLDEKNPEAYYVLGRIHMRNNNPTEALKSADFAIELNPNYPAAYSLKSHAILGIYVKESYIGDSDLAKPPMSPEELKNREGALRIRFREAAESLDTFLRLSTKAAGMDHWREQLESLRLYSENADNATLEPKVRAPSDVGKKAVIKSKPSPFYPGQELAAGTSGTVTVMLTLSFDGTIKNVLVLSAPSTGFAIEAVKAAHKIKFIPAIKNGVPVSQYIKVEYNFNIF